MKIGVDKESNNSSNEKHGKLSIDYDSILRKLNRTYKIIIILGIFSWVFLTMATLSNPNQIDTKVFFYIGLFGMGSCGFIAGLLYFGYIQSRIPHCINCNNKLEYKVSIKNISSSYFHCKYCNLQFPELGAVL